MLALTHCHIDLIMRPSKLRERRKEIVGGGRGRGREERVKRKEGRKAEIQHKQNQALTWPFHADGFLHLGSMGTESILEAVFY